jgi:TonB family protein
MEKRNKREGRNIYIRPAIAFIIALLINVGVIFFISFTLNLFKSEKDKEKDSEDIIVVSLQDDKQVSVDLKKPDDKVPPDTKFRTTQNSNPKEERVKRDKTPKKKFSRPKKPSSPPKKSVKLRKPSKKTQKSPKNKSVDVNKLKIGEIGVKNKTKPQTGKKSSDKQDLKLYPTVGQMEKILGIPSSDYIVGIRSGDETALKTKKWVGSSFFLRIKQAVAQVWNPGGVYKKHDPDGSFYGFKDWFTVLKISLDSKGRIKKLMIYKNSGLVFLDKEAFRAFRMAGPFPNPPKEIVDPVTGLITFKFGFMVEVTTKVDFKLFKY